MKRKIGILLAGIMMVSGTGLTPVHAMIGHSIDASEAAAQDMVYIQTIAPDAAKPELYQDAAAKGVLDMDLNMYYNGEIVESELGLKKIDGVIMVPLADVLRAMGYDVEWIEETRSVEILKGPHWTKVSIGENSYFKNKMAPRPLSAAPQIVEGRTYVPAEFFVEIMGKSISVENSELKFTDQEPNIISGYVNEVSYDETGSMRITISAVKDSKDPLDYTVVHTAKAYTHFNKKVEEGQFINIACSMIMTNSIPPQTSGYLTY